MQKSTNLDEIIETYYKNNNILSKKLNKKIPQSLKP